MTDLRAAFAKIHKLQEEMNETSHLRGGVTPHPICIRLPDDATRDTEEPSKRAVVQGPGV